MYRFLSYGLVIFISTANCVKPYDFKPEEPGRYLVVNGSVNQSNDINRIYLTLSTTYGSNTNARPVEDAEIFLVNSKNEKEPFYYEGDGYYAHYGNTLKVQVGEAYHIEMESRSRSYRSKPQIMPEPVVPDSISYRVGHITTVNLLGNEVTNENIDIFINSPINQHGDKTFLRWKTDEAWMFTEKICSPFVPPRTCYMKGTLEDDRIFIYSGKGLTGNYLAGKLVAQKRIYDRAEFIQKHFFNVHQYTLTEEAYDYWEKVVLLANPSGDIFDLPPAPLSGNVYNIDDRDEIVLGYFEVAAKATVRVPLYREDIHPFRVSDKQYLCGWRSEYAQICCNCLLLENSSYERPDYW